MLDSKPQKKHGGFTLLEILIVLSVIAILGALAVPRMMTAVNDISLRYVASDYSGLLQSARVRAVKLNTFYSVQAGTLAGGTSIHYIDKPTVVYAAPDPFMPINTGITVWQGPGSGAPNEAAFIASLLFTVDPNHADAPSFSARGLPCVGAAGSCNPVAGQGFVVFMSRPTVTGNIPWVAVVVNPSGHIQIWTCDNTGAWIQRD
jgi:prepilin-type N-terminal cleavage/methylation domain-containing protein